MLYNMGVLMSAYMLYDRGKLTFTSPCCPPFLFFPNPPHDNITVYPPDSFKCSCVINNFYCQCLPQISSILLAQNLLCSLYWLQTPDLSLPSAGAERQAATAGSSHSLVSVSISACLGLGWKALLQVLKGDAMPHAFSRDSDGLVYLWGELSPG